MSEKYFSPQENAALEEHLTVAQIATAWKLDDRTVQRLFEGKSGVMKLGTERRRILRIPVSVAESVRRELSA